METQTDQLWMQAMVDYIGGDLDGDGDRDIADDDYGISYSFWSWNPNSGDTGGTLMDDWRTLNQDKLSLLAPVQTPFPPTSDNPQTNQPEVMYASVTVELSRTYHSTVTIKYRTLDGTATAGVYYAPVSGTVSIEAGQTSAVVLVPILGDLLTEPSETFMFEVYDANDALIDDSISVISISDQD